jgi:hypothetical protein
MRTLCSMFAALALVMAACGDGGGDAAKDARPGSDAGIVDAPTTPTDDASCFTNPTSHNELINACTDAQPVEKNPTLPLVLPDGGLPPLPQ